MPDSTPTSPPGAPAYPADAFARFNPSTTLWNPDNARALVYASELAYADAATIQATAPGWGFNRVTVISPSTSVLQAIVLGSDTAVVVAFRGTRPDQIADWMADIHIQQTPFTEYFTSPSIGSVHDGFAYLLTTGWKSIVSEIAGCQDKSQTLWVTGHSLGGALAVMATAAITFSVRQPVNGLYTFGQPRVGDMDFCAQCDSHFGNVMFRFVNNEDIVTRVPPRVVPHLPLPDFYGHSGQLRFFDAAGALHSDDHFWNSFLISVDVGFENMKTLLAEPVLDHSLTNYAANIEKYLKDLATGTQKPV